MYEGGGSHTTASEVRKSGKLRQLQVKLFIRCVTIVVIAAVYHSFLPDLLAG